MGCRETAGSRNVRWALWAVALGCAVPGGAAATEALRPAFALGETLTYAVKWGPIRAGTARMAVESIEDVQGRPCYHIVSTVESNGFFSVFYPVRDRVETWVDVERLVPLRHVKRLQEGTYRQDESMWFDHEAGRARYSDGEWVDFAPGVQDFLSALYYVRSLKFPQEGSIFVENQTNKKNYTLEVRQIGRETVDTPLGRFPCVVIEPILQTTALFKQEGRLWIWLTETDERLPAQMKSRIKVGSITAVLESVERAPAPPGAGTGRGGER